MKERKERKKDDMMMQASSDLACGVDGFDDEINTRGRAMPCCRHKHLISRLNGRDICIDCTLYTSSSQ